MIRCKLKTQYGTFSIVTTDGYNYRLLLNGKVIHNNYDHSLEFLETDYLSFI